MEKGKIVKSVGIELLDDKVIKLLQEGESYKYLGILEADDFLEEEMKLNVLKEYVRGNIDTGCYRGDNIDGLEVF